MANHVTAAEEQQPSLSDRALIAGRVDRLPVLSVHRRLASTVGVGNFFDGFDAVSLAVVLPIIVATFHINLAEGGLIISAGYAGQFAGAMIIGPLADRIGRRKAFIISLVVLGGLALCTAFAWSSSSLLVMRLIQGFGLGAEVPVAAILINEYLGRRSRGRLVVVYQSLFAWGLFFAPLVALLLTTVLGRETGWRVLFGVGAIPALIAVVAWFTLPESPRWLAANGRVQEASAQLDALEAEAKAKGKALGELEAPQITESKPSKFSELFAPGYRRLSIGTGLVWFLSFTVSWGYVSWLPTMYVTVGGLPTSMSLTLTAAVSAYTIALVYGAAAVVDRVGRRPLLIAGLVIAAIGALYGAIMIGLVGLTSWPVLLVAGIILATGCSMPGILFYLYTAELYPTRLRARATASGSALNRASAVVSPALFGWVLSSAGGAAMVFLILFVAGALAAIAFIMTSVEMKNKPMIED